MFQALKAFVKFLDMLCDVITRTNDFTKVSKACNVLMILKNIYSIRQILIAYLADKKTKYFSHQFHQNDFRHREINKKKNT